MGRLKKLSLFSLHKTKSKMSQVLQLSFLYTKTANREAKMVLNRLRYEHPKKSKSRNKSLLLIAKASIRGNKDYRTTIRV